MILCASILAYIITNGRISDFDELLLSLVNVIRSSFGPVQGEILITNETSSIIFAIGFTVCIAIINICIFF